MLGLDWLPAVTLNEFFAGVAVFGVVLLMFIILYAFLSRIHKEQNDLLKRIKYPDPGMSGQELAARMRREALRHAELADMFKRIHEFESVTIDREPLDYWTNHIPEQTAEAVSAKEEQISNFSGQTIPLNSAETMSGYDRVLWAEQLILQLPGQHEGRNSWLLNYGRSIHAAGIRHAHDVGFDEITLSAKFH